VKEILEKILTDFKRDRNPTENTMLAFRGAVTRFIEHAQAKGRATLDEITREDVVEYLNGIQARTSSKKVFDHWITLFFNRALEGGHRKEKMPTIGYRGPADVPRATLKGFTAAELRTMMGREGNLPIRDRAIFNLLVRRPMRIGELVAMKVEDVDIENGTLTVVRSKNRNPRVLSIPQEALEGMKQLTNHGKKPEDSVFGLGPRSMQETVNAIIQRLGVKRNGRSAHAFRHTVIVNMLRSLKLDPAVIGELAGNTPKTIYDHYSKVSLDDTRRASQELDRLFAAGMKEGS
jgi:integrase/recombinase XerD